MLLTLQVRNKNMPKIIRTSLEKAGFGLTVICAIHCLATPFAISALPYMSGQFASLHQYENSILIISFIVAGILLIKDYLTHRNLRPLFLLGIAIFIKIVGTLFFKNQELLQNVAMSLAIIYAYILNWQHKARCSCKVTH